MPINPAQLMILRYPAPELRNRARAVPKIDDEVRAVAARMIELMQDVQGLGLAAPQVGLPWRMFVTEVPDEGKVMVYINPSLSNFGKETDVYEEGCLSLPGVHVDITRPTSVTMTATGLDGQPITVSSDAFPARVWQHEVDHLNGTLILDRMGPVAKIAARKKLRELEDVYAKAHPRKKPHKVAR